VTHTPNPQFADVTDMLRLNDINTGYDVIEQMKHRAFIARAAMPDHLIDTDNWPMKNRTEWRRYLALQRHLGVPALYYASQVAGQPLTRQDHERLRELGFKRGGR